jgi:hypothetical protein
MKKRADNTIPSHLLLETEHEASLDPHIPLTSIHPIVIDNTISASPHKTTLTTFISSPSSYTSIHEYFKIQDDRIQSMKERLNALQIHRKPQMLSDGLLLERQEFIRHFNIAPRTSTTNDITSADVRSSTMQRMLDAWKSRKTDQEYEIPLKRYRT